MLKPFLKVIKTNNNELLLLLEHAYSVARYSDEYEINEVQVGKIRSEFYDFIKEIETLYNKHLNHCTQSIDRTDNKVNNTKKIETKNDSPKKDDLIMAKISDMINKKQYKLRPGGLATFDLVINKMNLTFIKNRLLSSKIQL